MNNNININNLPSSGSQPLLAGSPGLSPGLSPGPLSNHRNDNISHVGGANHIGEANHGGETIEAGCRSLVVEVRQLDS